MWSKIFLFNIDTFTSMWKGTHQIFFFFVLLDEGTWTVINAQQVLIPLPSPGLDIKMITGSNNTMAGFVQEEHFKYSTYIEALENETAQQPLVCSWAVKRIYNIFYVLY